MLASKLTRVTLKRANAAAATPVRIKPENSYKGHLQDAKTSVAAELSSPIQKGS